MQVITGVLYLTALTLAVVFSTGGWLHRAVWAAVITAGWFALTVYATRRAETERRRRQFQSWSIRGLCPGCGYDIHATPAACPECGFERPTLR